MPFTLTHVLLSERLVIEEHRVPDGRSYSVALEFGFHVHYPGRLSKRVTATVRHLVRPELDDVDGNPRGTRPQIAIDHLDYTLRIIDPSGAEHTRDEITLADIAKFRDRRGFPVGNWRCKLSATSRVYANDVQFDARTTAPPGALQLSIVEDVASASAPARVPHTKLTDAAFRASFDLNHVGTFVAHIMPFGPFEHWRGTIRLLDPDGIEITTTDSSQLRIPIGLRTLAKSRDAIGNARMWTLEVESRSGLDRNDYYISATVLNDGRVSKCALVDRIQSLVGEHGRSIGLIGRNVDDDIEGVLTLRDVRAAETVDMYGLIDGLLEKTDAAKNLEVDVPVVVYRRSAELAYGLTMDASSLTLTAIDVDVAPSSDPGLGPETPVLRLDVKVDGELRMALAGQPVANAKLRGGKLRVELGLAIDSDGTPRLVRWTDASPLDIDSDDSAIAIAIATSGVLALGLVALTEYIEHEANEILLGAFDELFADPMLGAKILMTMYGAHFSYLGVRLEGDDVLFQHVAPPEPDPRPRPGYTEVIGRTAMTEANGFTRMPPLGDTWKADNLTRKIDHIVVVMMENRSYDHVLGARALPPISDGADGWTAELRAAVDAAAVTPRDPGGTVISPPVDLPPVHALRSSSLEKNRAERRTRIPKGVGHALASVQHQLSGRVEGPRGQINDPRGFTEDFYEHSLARDEPTEWVGCSPYTVLGYYETDADDETTDLPLTAFLAQHYAYCDRYFCSHAGPTLPNRMYWLTGDVQRDRTGVPILDNNHGDNFLLSRAQTIFDVLTRHGVGWRVYESFPSVTMLRMFARYATDDVDIRRLERLEGDIASGDLPAVTVIEPAMHHHPQDDDHPDADMWRGQQFLQRVYEALRSNNAVWERTLLLITYDEHGGLYDHVIPPIAERIDDGPAVVNAPVSPPRSSTDPGASAGGFTFHREVLISGGNAPARGFTFHPEVVHELVGLPEAVVAPAVEIPYGVRVPTLVVSPWVSPGKGPSIVLDHCSIMKTILARFCGDTRPFMSERIEASYSFETYLDADAPRADPGPSPVLADLPESARRLLPGTSAIITPPLVRSRMRHGPVEYHELTGRLARQLGR